MDNYIEIYNRFIRKHGGMAIKLGSKLSDSKLSGEAIVLSMLHMVNSLRSNVNPDMFNSLTLDNTVEDLFRILDNTSDITPKVIVTRQASMKLYDDTVLLIPSLTKSAYRRMLKLSNTQLMYCNKKPIGVVSIRNTKSAIEIDHLVLLPTYELAASAWDTIFSIMYSMQDSYDKDYKLAYFVYDNRDKERFFYENLILLIDDSSVNELVAFDEEGLLNVSLNDVMALDCPINNDVPFPPTSNEDYYPENMAGIKEFLDNNITQYGSTDYSSGIYSFPVFTPEFCEKLRSFSKLCAYECNEEEPSEAQIPEIVIESYSYSLFAKIEYMFHNIVDPISSLVFFNSPSTLHTAQFAKYTPETTYKGNWHKDVDSDITLVINLGDNFRGGGTIIKPNGLGAPIEVPPLPIGHGLLFNGKSMSHMGLPVMEGERDLLVFWSEVS